MREAEPVHMLGCRLQITHMITAYVDRESCASVATCQLQSAYEFCNHLALENDPLTNYKLLFLREDSNAETVRLFIGFRSENLCKRFFASYETAVTACNLSVSPNMPATPAANSSSAAAPVAVTQNAQTQSTTGVSNVGDVNKEERKSNLRLKSDITTAFPTPQYSPGSKSTVSQTPTPAQSPTNELPRLGHKLGATQAFKKFGCSFYRRVSFHPARGSEPAKTLAVPFGGLRNAVVLNEFIVELSKDMNLEAERARMNSIFERERISAEDIYQCLISWTLVDCILTAFRTEDQKNRFCAAYTSSASATSPIPATAADHVDTSTTNSVDIPAAATPLAITPTTQAPANLAPTTSNETATDKAERTTDEKLSTHVKSETPVVDVVQTSAVSPPAPAVTLPVPLAAQVTSQPKPAAQQSPVTPTPVHIQAPAPQAAPLPNDSKHSQVSVTPTHTPVPAPQVGSQAPPASSIPVQVAHQFAPQRNPAAQSPGTPTPVHVQAPAPQVAPPTANPAAYQAPPTQTQTPVLAQAFAPQGPVTQAAVPAPQPSSLQAVPPPTPAMQAPVTYTPPASQVPPPQEYMQMYVLTEQQASSKALHQYGYPAWATPIPHEDVIVLAEDNIEAVRDRVNWAFGSNRIMREDAFLCLVERAWDRSPRIFVSCKTEREFRCYLRDFHNKNQGPPAAWINTNVAAPPATNSYHVPSNSGAPLHAQPLPAVGNNLIAQSAQNVPNTSNTPLTSGVNMRFTSPGQAYANSASMSAGTPNSTGQGMVMSNTASVMPPQNNGSYAAGLNNFTNTSQAPPNPPSPTGFGANTQHAQSTQVVPNHANTYPWNHNPASASQGQPGSTYNNTFLANSQDAYSTKRGKTRHK